MMAGLYRWVRRLPAVLFVSALHVVLLAAILWQQPDIVVMDKTEVLTFVALDQPAVTREVPSLPQRVEPKTVPASTPILAEVVEDHPPVENDTTSAAQKRAPADNAISVDPLPPPTGKTTENYFAAIRACLERAKRYPPEARTARIEGIVWLGFAISRNGQVLRWDVQQGSGSSVLDSEVRAMADRVFFPPVPADIDSVTLSFVVPIEFALSRA